MGALEIIIALALVGFLMIAVEIFVPGLVLGSLGTLCLFGAVIVGYVQFGVLTGTLIFAGLAVVTMVGFIIWMASFPHTAIGRKIMLKKSLVQGDGLAVQPLGLQEQEGVALTPLRPAGTARFDGRKIDVVAESDFIEAGEAVRVVQAEGMRVVVRKMP
jgi:membrane-bound serine protease (ClpP class)